MASLSFRGWSPPPLVPARRRPPRICATRAENRDADPQEVLGLPSGTSFTLDDVKAAFRAKVKEYHPDVYKGSENAEAITQSLIQAYERYKIEMQRLCLSFEQATPRARDGDLLSEDDADDVFVNELLCIGRGCPYSCVSRAPSVFVFAPDTGRGRAVAQGESGDYSVQLAVGQCPRSCIYFVTSSQRQALEAQLQRILEDPMSSENEVIILEDLIAQASIENRTQKEPRRKPNRSDEFVDHY